jgi:hypothetical protein
LPLQELMLAIFHQALLHPQNHQQNHSFFPIDFELLRLQPLDQVL